MTNYNIIFTSDRNYIQHIGVTLYSLLFNNNDLNFNIYIITDEKNKNKFNKLNLIALQFNCNIEIVNIDNKIFNQLSEYCHLTKAAYFRILIPDLINQSKVLYLDIDIIVNGSIKELYNTNLNNFALAAVEDPGFDWHEDLKMDLDSKYFNSGVMLINPKKWNEMQLQSKVIDFISKNSSSVRFADQCGLNAVINGKWKNLELKYNLQTNIFENNPKNNLCFSESEIKEGINNPVIIHFTGASKPWFYRNKHPYKNLYWKYLKKTPFYYSLLIRYYILFFRYVLGSLKRYAFSLRKG